MSRKESCGTCLPTTSTQTVSGVASSKPTGPHNHIQKTAASITATADTPVFLPYSQGSNRLLLNSSSATNRPTVQMVGAQPGENASDSPIGSRAAIQGPMYGTNRNAIATMPQRTALGTPMK